ncbi:MAG: hypothetical protein IKF80_10770 [Erysipelotrichaceae bacterium]|nr:hypothetical protein [Erysipelotrichaceae bacterium]
MTKLKDYRLTLLLSLCHMGIDFLCAFSLYHSFAKRYEAFLLYNFCAFALQMPMGILIDMWSDRCKKTIRPGMLFMCVGVALTIIGSFLSHIILGIGNALFHVGGGVLSIHEDDDHGLDGKALGCFVAPGAIGLILGILYHDTDLYLLIQIIVAVALCGVSFFAFRSSEERQLTIKYRKFSFERKELIYIILLCFVVVIIRSLTGMAISFPWKKGDLITIISVIAVASGKMIGGFLSSEYGMKKTVIITLCISALAYFFADYLIPGMLALLFFNMTMPITLYLLSMNMSDMPGFAFGILTFGLFLGYLPVHYGYVNDLAPSPFGVMASLVSLAILYLAIKISKKEQDHE